VVVQGIKLGTDNVLFYKEKYYAKSTQQSYLAEMPRGYGGQYGPRIQAVVLAFYYGMGASEPKILDFTFCAPSNAEAFAFPASWVTDWAFWAPC